MYKEVVMVGVMVIGIWALLRVILPFVLLIVLGTLLQRQNSTRYGMR